MNTTTSSMSAGEWYPSITVPWDTTTDPFVTITTTDTTTGTWQYTVVPRDTKQGVVTTADGPIVRELQDEGIVDILEELRKTTQLSTYIPAVPRIRLV